MLSRMLCGTVEAKWIAPAVLLPPRVNEATCPVSGQGKYYVPANSPSRAGAAATAVCGRWRATWNIEGGPLFTLGVGAACQAANGRSTHGGIEVILGHRENKVGGLLVVDGAVCKRKHGTAARSIPGSGAAPAVRKAMGIMVIKNQLKEYNHGRLIERLR